ncbi:hypothetical protein PGTUg99_012663 [Puccinia graminis f. sp. tritici]|uniref:Uncharacterized protein n=1 Tax=Puccinia graminis f. sp. tritici TaxID=56615 RepID=A0A5B0LIB5_PUCGR|nr:hypothetical protein PGTUg99_012663 [Puccinia graminis f. sp. tritici]
MLAPNRPPAHAPRNKTVRIRTLCPHTRVPGTWLSASLKCQPLESVSPPRSVSTRSLDSAILGLFTPSLQKPTYSCLSSSSVPPAQGRLLWWLAEGHQLAPSGAGADGFYRPGLARLTWAGTTAVQLP